MCEKVETVKENKITFEELVEQQVKLLHVARDKLVAELNKKPKDGVTIKTGGTSGKGRNIGENDRRLYVWIECIYKGKEYCINLFESEIDYRSGNCHCQIGKVKFTKGYLQNYENACSSPNEIIKSSKKFTHLIFNSWKWEKPFDYFENKDVKRLVNGKWVTVDDVLNSDELTSDIVKGFFEFIDEDNG
jgi:hypothetical protein